MAAITEAIRRSIRRSPYGISTIAEKSGIDESTLRGFVEDDPRETSQETLQKLVEFFGLTLSESGGTWNSVAVISTSLGLLTLFIAYFANLINERSNVRESLGQFRAAVSRLNEISSARDVAPGCMTCMPVVNSEISTYQGIEARLHFNAARSLESQLRGSLNHADYSALAFHTKTFLGIEQAKAYYATALECAKSHDPLAEVEVYANLGALYFQNGELEAGRQHFDLAFTRIKSIPEMKRSKQFVAGIYAGLAVSEYEFGMDQYGKEALQSGFHAMAGHPEQMGWKRTKDSEVQAAVQNRKVRNGEIPAPGGHEPAPAPGIPQPAPVPAPAAAFDPTPPAEAPPAPLDPNSRRIGKLVPAPDTSAAASP